MFQWIEKLRRWHRGGDEKFTVACDISPFGHPGNSEERLFHIIGIKAARRFAHRWVGRYVCGQARILKGELHHDRK